MEKNLTEVFVTKVIKENDDLVMLIDPKHFNKLGIEENSIWLWEVKSADEIILRKTNTKSQL